MVVPIITSIICCGLYWGYPHKIILGYSVFYYNVLNFMVVHKLGIHPLQVSLSQPHRILGLCVRSCLRDQRFIGSVEGRKASCVRDWS